MARSNGPSIIQVMTDPELLGSFFQGTSWQPWKACLKAFFDLRLGGRERELYRACTGRERPPGGASEAFLIVGRRGGKSIISALVAVFLACFRDYRPHLGPGEVATVLLIATDRKQARVVFRYVRGFLGAVPMLEALVVGETKESIELSNRVAIEVHTASFRAVRGYAIAAAVCDELAFWRSEDSANPDTEILEALRPGMATIPGSKLVAIGSPYSRRGELWKAFREHYGKERDELLVWRAPSRVMNPTLRQAVVDQARERDPQAARSEWDAEFRSDLQDFIPAAVVEGCIEPGCRERLPVAGFEYSAFVDPSGGSQDSMTLGIAHREGDVAVLDLVRERKPPFSPDDVVSEFARVSLPYGINAVIGDKYAGVWVSERFQQHGIRYEPADKTKSELYLEALPLLNAGRARLLDNDRLRVQLCSLERRTSRSGRDSVDHAPNAHDDIANAVAGALVSAAKPVWKPQRIRLLKGGGRSYNPEKQILDRYIRIRRLGGGIWAPHDEAAICDYVESRRPAPETERANGDLAMTFTFANETHPVIPPEALQKQEKLGAAELTKLHALSDELQAELAELDGPEAKGKFTDAHLKEERRRVREKFLGRAAEIESEIATITERPLSEESFWQSPTRLLRGARLTPRSKPLERKAFVTNGERELFEHVQLQRQGLDAVSESSTRAQLMQELAFADEDDFLERVDDALAKGNLAELYLSNLVARQRGGKLRSAVTHRVLKVRIPEREQALESLEAIKEIASAANSTVGYMRGNRESDPHRSVRRIRAEQDEAAAAAEALLAVAQAGQ